MPHAYISSLYNGTCIIDWDKLGYSDEISGKETTTIFKNQKDNRQSM